jgi:hypothetical protein
VVVNPEAIQRSHGGPAAYPTTCWKNGGVEQVRLELTDMLTLQAVPIFSWQCLSGIDNVNQPISQDIPLWHRWGR